jgi:hypothetical protein
LPWRAAEGNENRAPLGSLEKCAPEGARSEGSDRQGADEGVNGDERENEGVDHGRKLLLARGKLRGKAIEIFYYGNRTAARRSGFLLIVSGA